MLKIKKFCSVFIVCLLGVYLSYGASFVQLDEEELQKVKQSIFDGSASEELMLVYKQLINSADRALVNSNYSVVDKTMMPPSGNKHDYLSISRYWWPNPESKDSLPWVRRDGVTNPATQTNAVDRKRLGSMTASVKALALAYYFTDKEKYAQKSTELLRTWFLDDETNMNPNLKYAQSVPGNKKGRRSGILDGRLIPVWVLDAIELISESEHWSSNDAATMKLWLQDYLEWLTKSDLGKKGAKQVNNHGSWYWYQVTALSWYLKQDKLLEWAIEQTKLSLNFQLDSLGGQIHELERTRSFFYSCFNLEALTRIAIIAEKAEKPFWNYETDEGKSLKLALDFLLPVAEGEAWMYPSKEIDLAYLVPVLGRAKGKIASDKYEVIFQNLMFEILEKENINKNDYRAMEEFLLLRNGLKVLPNP